MMKNQMVWVIPCTFWVDWSLLQVWADIEAKKNPDNLTNIVSQQHTFYYNQIGRT